MQSTPSTVLTTPQCCPVRTADIPVLGGQDWVSICERHVASGGRVSALMARPAANAEPCTILAVLADDRHGHLGLLQTTTDPRGAFPSLAARLPQVQAFERELTERDGLSPQGHPWSKSLLNHPAPGNSGEPAIDPTHPFFTVDGDGIHEVAVGPVHAGIIEPGHFRFQCYGEKVLHLEIRLGYQHRGAEALLLRSPPARRRSIAESIAGDTSVGHTLGYCMALESLSDCEVPLPAQRIRAIGLELERLANHVGDLGALCNDVGYLPASSWYGRLRGEFLNLLLCLCGNRFGRGLVDLGGVCFDIPKDLRTHLTGTLTQLSEQVDRIAEMLFDSGSVCARFDHTGVLSTAVAQELGLVGPVARASGCGRDIRSDYPFGVYRYSHIPVSVADTGDVMARALVRWLEARRSIQFVSEQLQQLRDEHSIRTAVGPARPDSLVIALVETWRGEALHLAGTDAEGKLADYRIVDPSFHNWFGLSMALRDQQISDFPLCNKSFNLSYAGHDR